MINWLDVFIHFYYFSIFYTCSFEKLASEPSDGGFVFAEIKGFLPLGVLSDSAGFFQ